MAVLEAHAKINLYLRVTGKRRDGYHLLDTLFQEINLADRLRYEPSDDPISLEVTGADLGDTAQNLVVRAGKRFGQVTGCKVGGRFHLTKQIPAGGGLGGGSSDAAAALTLLNRHWGEPLDREALVELGVGLGADIPFFFYGGCARGLGIGDVLTPAAPPDGPRGGFLLFPGMPISTPAVFRALKLNEDERGPAVLGENDLLAPAKAVSPEFARVYDQLSVLFADAILFMSGSGSTVVLLTDRGELTLEERSRLHQLNMGFTPFHFVDSHPV